MIERLLQLEVTGFRAVQGSRHVSLDADVVLIHGSNGSGKSSLLQALEFALTAEVRELREFDADYPTCLAHEAATSSCVSVRFRTERGEQTQTVSIRGRRTINTDVSVLEPADRTNFAERCLLSQRQFGRLFELFQTVGENGEQPLVTFVRQLLQLDLVENLTQGLDVISIVTKVRRQVPAYQTLESEIERWTETRDALRTEYQALPTVDALLESSSESTRKLLSELLPPADRTAHDQATYQRVIASLAAAMQRLEADVASVDATVNQFQQQHVELRNVLAAIEAASSTLSERDQVQAELDQCRATRTLHEPRLLAVVTEWQSLASKSDRSSLTVSTDFASMPLRESWRLAGEWCDEQLRRQEQVQQRLADARQLERELSTRDAAAQVALARWQEQAALLATQRAWAKTLNDVLQHVTGNECPICQRDYQEMGRGQLSEHLQSEINRRHQDLEQNGLEEQQGRDLERQVAEVQRELMAVRCQMTPLQSEVELAAARESSLGSLIARRRELEADFESWSAAQQRLSLLEARLREFELLAERAEASRRQLLEFAKASSMSRLIQELPLAQLATTVDELLSDRLRDETARQAEAHAGLHVVSTLHRAWLRRRAIVEEGRQAAARLDRLNGAKKRIDDDIQKARDLVKVANTVQTAVMTEVFNESLNELWRDFFRRLAINEPFDVWLDELKVIARKMKVRFATTSGAITCQQPGAILSAGHLNAAAISLYLAIHLLEQTGHRVLVLDDPVQGLDAEHVQRLAQLLREIAHSSKRQLIIAVHDTATRDVFQNEFVAAGLRTDVVELGCHSKYSGGSRTKR